MTKIEVSIPDELLSVMESRARLAGLDQGEYLSTLVARDLSGPRTFEEIVAPFCDDVKRSGMTDSELDELFEDARNEAWPAKVG